MSIHKKRHLLAVLFVLVTFALVWGMFKLGMEWWLAALVLITSGLLYKVGLAFADGALTGSKKRTAAKEEEVADKLRKASKELGHAQAAEAKALELFPGQDETSRRCRAAYLMGAVDHA